MKKQMQYESIQEPLDDEERELMNPDNWDWDNLIDGVTVSEPRASLTIPLTFDELSAVVEAAHAQGLSTEEFIKRLVLNSLQAAPHVTSSFTLKLEAHLIAAIATTR